MNVSSSLGVGSVRLSSVVVSIGRMTSKRPGTLLKAVRPCDRAIGVTCWGRGPLALSLQAVARDLGLQERAIFLRTGQTFGSYRWRMYCPAVFTPRASLALARRARRAYRGGQQDAPDTRLVRDGDRPRSSRERDRAGRQLGVHSWTMTAAVGWAPWDVRTLCRFSCQRWWQLEAVYERVVAGQPSRWASRQRRRWVIL
jgi:hypothetical protein